jgi:hypothetical protein
MTRLRQLLSDAFSPDTILLTLCFAVSAFCFLMPEVTYG